MIASSSASYFAPLGVEMIPVLLGGAFASAVVGFFGMVVRGVLLERKLARRIAQAPIQPLRQVRPDQDVRVIGQVTADSEVQAPLSGRTCIAWQLQLDYRGEHDWQRQQAEASDHVVELVDDSGRATLQLARAGWELTHTHAVFLPDFPELRDQPITAWLADNPILHVIFGDGVGARARLTERILERGTRVCVFGQARCEGVLAGAATGSSYRDPPLRLVFAASEQHPLLLLDPGTAARP